MVSSSPFAQLLFMRHGTIKSNIVSTPKPTMIYCIMICCIISSKNPLCHRFQRVPPSKMPFSRNCCVSIVGVKLYHFDDHHLSASGTDCAAIIFDTVHCALYTVCNDCALCTVQPSSLTPNKSLGKALPLHQTLPNIAKHIKWSNLHLFKCSKQIYACPKGSNVLNLKFKCKC